MCAVRPRRSVAGTRSARCEAFPHCVKHDEDVGRIKMQIKRASEVHDRLRMPVLCVSVSRRSRAVSVVLRCLALRQRFGLQQFVQRVFVQKAVLQDDVAKIGRPVCKLSVATWEAAS